MPAPSWKNSRFSGKKRGNRSRFTCRSSTSDCAKSVRQVASAVKLGVTRHFMTSRPAFDELSHARSEPSTDWDTPARANGFTRSRSPVSNSRSPARCPACEMFSIRKPRR